VIKVSDNDTSHLAVTAKVGKAMDENTSLQTITENLQEWCRRPMVVRSFQTRAATTGKARSPTVDNRVRRTISDDVMTLSKDDLEL